MVRTKADSSGKRAVAAKATRKVLAPTSSNSGSSSALSPSSSKAGRYVGGNPVCARPTPEWQKGISSFMKKVPDKDVKPDAEDENQPVDGENQPVVEVNDKAVASGSSSQTSSSSSAVGECSSGRQRNGIIDSDDED